MGDGIGMGYMIRLLLDRGLEDIVLMKQSSP